MGRSGETVPTFWYKAVGHENTPAEGTIAAASRREALQRLIASGQHPLDLREQSEVQGATGFRLNFGRRPIRLATFTRQLATLSATGSPIIKGLSVITEQTKDRRMQVGIGHHRPCFDGPAVNRHTGDTSLPLIDFLDIAPDSNVNFVGLQFCFHL